PARQRGVSRSHLARPLSHANQENNFALDTNRAGIKRADNFKIIPKRREVRRAHKHTFEPAFQKHGRLLLSHARNRGPPSYGTRSSVTLRYTRAIASAAHAAASDSRPLFSQILRTCERSRIQAIWSVMNALSSSPYRTDLLVPSP